MINVQITDARLCVGCGYSAPPGANPPFITVYLSSYRFSLCRACAKTMTTETIQKIYDSEVSTNG